MHDATLSIPQMVCLREMFKRSNVPLHNVNFRRGMLYFERGENTGATYCITPDGNICQVIGGRDSIPF